MSRNESTLKVGEFQTICFLVADGYLNCCPGRKKSPSVDGLCANPKLIDHSSLWHPNSDGCGLAEIIEREEGLVGLLI